MKLNFDFDTKIDFDVHVDVEGFTPERHSPTCSDPDNPAYSDSGDPADFDMFTCFFVFNYAGKKFKMEFPEELYNILEDKLFEEIFEQGKDYADKMIVDIFDTLPNTHLHKAM